MEAGIYLLFSLTLAWIIAIPLAGVLKKLAQLLGIDLDRWFFGKKDDDGL